MVNLILGDRVLDVGLAALDAEATHIYVCNSQPTTYAEATSTFALGNKNFGAGAVFAAPAAASPGRSVTSVAVSGGTITTSGTVAYWAVTDNTASRLLATGALTGGAAVTAGQGFTLGSFVIQQSGTGVSGTAYDTATESWILAVGGAGGTVSDKQKGVVDTLILGLKDKGLWPLCDALWLFAGEEDIHQANFDIRNLRPITIVGSPVLTWRGYEDPTGASALDTGFALNTPGLQYLQDSASFAVWMSKHSDFGDNVVQIGAATGTYLICRIVYSLPGWLAYINSSTALNVVSPAGAKNGLWLASRTSSTLLSGYYNTTSLGDVSSTSDGVPTSSASFLARHDGGSTYSLQDFDPIAIGWIGGGLTSTQATDLYDLVRAYLKNYNISVTTNFALNSQQFDGTAWGRGSGVVITPNNAIAPDGTLTADLYSLTSGSHSGDHYILQTEGGTGNFTWSVFAKPNSWTWLAMRMNDGSVDKWCYFNLTDGTSVPDSGVTAATTLVDGFYRCAMSRTMSAIGSAQIWLASSSTSADATGSGTNGAWLWGAQFETGLLATDYNRAP